MVKFAFLMGMVPAVALASSPLSELISSVPHQPASDVDMAILRSVEKELARTADVLVRTGDACDCKDQGRKIGAYDPEAWGSQCRDWDRRGHSWCVVNSGSGCQDYQVRRYTGGSYIRTCGIRAYADKVRKDMSRLAADLHHDAANTYDHLVRRTSEVIERVSGGSDEFAHLLKLHTAKHLFATATVFLDDDRVTHVGTGPCEAGGSARKPRGAGERPRPCLIVGLKSLSHRSSVRIPQVVADLADGSIKYIQYDPTETLGGGRVRAAGAQAGEQDILVAERATGGKKGGGDIRPEELRVGGAIAYRVDRRGWGGGSIGTFVIDKESDEVYVVTNNHVVNSHACLPIGEDYCDHHSDCSWFANPVSSLGGACHSSIGGNEAYLCDVNKVVEASNDEIEMCKAEVVLRLNTKKYDLALIRVPASMRDRVRCVTQRDGDKVSGPHEYHEANVFSEAERDAAWWKFWKRAFWSDTRKSWKNVLGSLIETGLPVFKDGQRTSETEGFVRSFGDSKRSDMSKRIYGDATTVDQFTLMSESGKICDQGDSGSSVLDKRGNAVIGVLWGGLDSGSTCYAMPLHTVATAIESFNPKLEFCSSE